MKTVKQTGQNDELGYLSGVNHGLIKVIDQDLDMVAGSYSDLREAYEYIRYVQSTEYIDRLNELAALPTI